MVRAAQPAHRGRAVAWAQSEAGRRAPFVPRAEEPFPPSRYVSVDPSEIGRKPRRRYSAVRRWRVQARHRDAGDLRQGSGEFFQT